MLDGYCITKWGSYGGSSGGDAISIATGGEEQCYVSRDAPWLGQSAATHTRSLNRHDAAVLALAICDSNDSPKQHVNNSIIIGRNGNADCVGSGYDHWTHCSSPLS